MQTDNMLSFH